MYVVTTPFALKIIFYTDFYPLLELFSIHLSYDSCVDKTDQWEAGQFAQALLLVEIISDIIKQEISI